MALEGTIRTIVLAAIMRPDDQALLVFRGYDPSKAQTFFRPLGGGVEFGETSEAALRRELREELGVEVRPIRNLGVLESIFVYAGIQGHEIAIIWLTAFDDPALYALDRLPYVEGATMDIAEWVQPSKLKAQGIPLYPDGLTELLQVR